MIKTKLKAKDGLSPIEPEMDSRGADRFEVPLTNEQRDEIIIALAIKAGIVQKPLTAEELAALEGEG